MLLEITEEEISAFQVMYSDNALWEYLECDEDDEEDIERTKSFKSLFTKFGITIR